jgi:hypothetical protein
MGQDKPKFQASVSDADDVSELYLDDPDAAIEGRGQLGSVAAQLLTPGLPRLAFQTARADGRRRRRGQRGGR